MQGQDKPSFGMGQDAKAGETPKLAGLKDAVAEVPSGNTASPDTVVLAIKCPSLSEAASESSLLTVSTRDSIRQVKEQIGSSWIGKPKASGMRMFRSGQLLTDDAVVGDIVASCDRAEPAAIHLVIRPTAWSEARPSMQRAPTSERYTSSSRRAPSPHPAWVNADENTRPKATSAAGSSGLPQGPSPAPLMSHSLRHSRLSPPSPQDLHLGGVLESMDPSDYKSFRSLLSWSYYRYVAMYEELWMQLYGDWAQDADIPAVEDGKTIEQLAKSMDCTCDEVLEAVLLMEREAMLWKPVEEDLAEASAAEAKDTTMIYKVVTLKGLPYLLQVQRDPLSGPLSVLLGRTKRLHEVIYRMDKLISYKALLEQAADSNALMSGVRNRHAALLAAATTANGGVVPRLAPDNVARNYRFRLVINVNDLLQIALPAFFLSLKVTLLVYIFTRGASTFKTYMIAGAGVMFVAFEAWRVAQRQHQIRHQAARRDAERRAGNDGQRRAPATEAAAGDQPGPDENSLESLRPHSVRRHRVISPMTADYWIERLARIGLEAEEREFQWHPLPPRQSDLAAMAQRRSAIWTIVKDYILLPLVLLAVTLIPEIEQKRRRAIDEREEIIRSTARKVEDRKARLAEKSKGEGTSHPPQLEGASTTAEEVPSYLAHPYCQRIIYNRRTGRQIDIAQELDAAAAAADDQDVNQADMGFF